MQRLRRHLPVLIAMPAVLALASCGGPGNAASDGAIKASISVPLPETGMINGTNWWVDEVEKRTEGRLEIEMYYNSSLLSASGGMDGMNDGRTQGAFIANSYRPEELPLMEIVGIPFETSDGYAMSRAYFDVYQNNEDFRAQLNDAGFHLSHMVPYTQTTFATREPLNEVADLKGKRFRAAGIVGNVVSDLGGDAIYLDTGDVYESVERGVIDGVAGWPVDLMADYGVAEPAPNITDIGYGHYAMGAIAFDLDWYDSLPDDIKDVMSEVTTEFHEKQMVGMLNDLERQACEKLQKVGAKVVVWDEQHVKALKSETDTDYVAEWTKSVTKNSGLSGEAINGFYSDFHAAYDQHLKDSAYENSIQQCAEQK